MCGIDHVLGVLGNGHLAMCGIGTTVEDLVYGNLTSDLPALWNHHPLLVRLRESVPAALEGVCGRCLFRRECKAQCVANNYHDHGRLTAPHWFCQAAYDAGLFPLSRLES
ncbi:hypothetical protein CCP3SC1_310022 [Gammaproteobacteria bacterium]